MFMSWPNWALYRRQKHKSTVHKPRFRKPWQVDGIIHMCSIIVHQIDFTDLIQLNEIHFACANEFFRYTLNHYSMCQKKFSPHLHWIYNRKHPITSIWGVCHWLSATYVCYIGMCHDLTYIISHWRHNERNAFSNLRDSIVCSTACSSVDQRKHENVSIWWRHHYEFISFGLLYVGYIPQHHLIERSIIHVMTFNILNNMYLSSFGQDGDMITYNVFKSIFLNESF